MFHVRHKETGKLCRVYAVSGLNFLLWNEDEECWYYDFMAHYKPYEVTA